MKRFDFPRNDTWFRSREEAGFGLELALDLGAGKKKRSAVKVRETNLICTAAPSLTNSLGELSDASGYCVRIVSRDEFDPSSSAFDECERDRC